MQEEEPSQFLYQLERQSFNSLKKLDLSKRVQNLKFNDMKNNKGPILYWMSREQRIQDNWALLYGIQQSLAQNKPFAVVFNLLPSFLGASARHFGFMLRGLKELQTKLHQIYGIPFILLRGSPEKSIAQYAKQVKSPLIVTDFSPLRMALKWKKDLVQNLQGQNIRVDVVDAHNIVPCWEASKQQEYMAKTIRPKITNKLGEFMTEFPELEPLDQKFEYEIPEIHWDNLIKEVIENNPEVKEVDTYIPGEEAAMLALIGKQDGWVQKKRLGKYKDKSNDPNLPNAISNLSPYIHFGQISAQRIALEVEKCKKQGGSMKESAEAYLEQIIIRKELTDNFCYYNENYDRIEGAYQWARDTLNDHRNDNRQYTYSKQQLEQGKTHDDLWNAAQKEMVYTGKMHNFMRMYWAKKILEWTESPEQALEFAIYLNDKYQLDGRDPNGYVGCMWSICGIHDQGWKERDVFGKVRYMNYDGCKRKFDVLGYIGRINKIVSSETNPFKSTKKSQQQSNLFQKKPAQKKQQDDADDESEEEEKQIEKAVKVKQQRAQEESRKKSVKKALNKKRKIQ